MRRWDFLAEPAYRNCSSGYAVSLCSPAMRVTTATGANKIAEHYEYLHDNQFGSMGGGGDLFQLPQRVRCWVSDVTSVNADGEAFVGIEFGSMKCAPPFQSHFDVSTLACIQLRFNFATARWEFLIYDCTEDAPTVEECYVQPTTLTGNTAAELQLDYMPGAFVQCYVSGTLVHEYRGARLAEFAVNGSGADAGAGIFVTSGSHAAGWTRVRFSMFEATTFGALERV